MAIFKSNLLSDIRGSLNGSTFSRTRAGNIIRNRTQPVQPNTPYQAAQRSYMQMAVDLFRALPGSEVEAWQEAIALSGFTSQNALGDSYVPSAKQVFTMAALNLSRQADAPVPPDLSKFIANSNLPGIIWDGLDIDVGTGGPATLDLLEIEGVATTVAGYMEVAATLPLTPAIRNYKKYLRTIGYAATTTTPADTAVTANYNDRFDDIDWNDFTGMNINLAIRALNPATGLAGAWIYIGGVAVPAPA